MVDEGDSRQKMRAYAQHLITRKLLSDAVPATFSLQTSPMGKNSAMLAEQ